MIEQTWLVMAASVSWESCKVASSVQVVNKIFNMILQKVGFCCVSSNKSPVLYYALFYGLAADTSVE